MRLDFDAAYLVRRALGDSAASYAQDAERLARERIARLPTRVSTETVGEVYERSLQYVDLAQRLCEQLTSAIEVAADDEWIVLSALGDSGVRHRRLAEETAANDPKLSAAHTGLAVKFEQAYALLTRPEEAARAKKYDPRPTLNTSAG